MSWVRKLIPINQIDQKINLYPDEKLIFHDVVALKESPFQASFGVLYLTTKRLFFYQTRMYDIIRRRGRFHWEMGLQLIDKVERDNEEQNKYTLLINSKKGEVFSLTVDLDAEVWVEKINEVLKSQTR